MDHHHHDHGQLRRDGSRRQAFKQRQVHHVDQAGQIISKQVVDVEFDVTGRDGDCVHGGVHLRDVDQDLGSGLYAPQGQLHEEPVELHGLLRCHIRVSKPAILFILFSRILQNANGFNEFMKKVATIQIKNILHEID